MLDLRREIVGLLAGLRTDGEPRRLTSRHDCRAFDAIGRHLPRILGGGGSLCDVGAAKASSHALRPERAGNKLIVLAQSDLRIA